jgi:hypothetical protein
MIRPPRLAAVLVAIALAAIAVPVADGAVVPAGVQPGATAVQAAVQAPAATKHASSAPCNVGIPIIGAAVSTITNAACSIGSTVAQGVGSIVSDVGNSILDGVASWLIGAATAVTSFVAEQMRSTTTPALESSWFEAQFAPIAALGAALALLVTLVALGSAALRRSPDALAATLVAVVRAGFGTGVIIGLMMIGLQIADAISTDILAGSTHTFWNTVSTAWGHHGFGGFGSSALAALIALVEVFGALFVWLELIVRNAVIYIAVLFFPVALAASIWPPLAGWTGRLGRLLLLFVMLKPVTLIVLSLAGNAAASGLSLTGGASASVGTILAAVVIFALAAFAPWALMYLLSADAESAWTAGAVRAGAGGAVAGTQGRSVRSGGGLANLRSGASGGASGGGASGGGAGGGSPSSGGRGGGGGDTSQGGGSGGAGARAGAASGGSSVGANGGGAAVAGVIGGGSVAAAAGLNASASCTGSPAGAGDGTRASRATHAAGVNSAGGAKRDGAGGGSSGTAGQGHVDRGSPVPRGERDAGPAAPTDGGGRSAPAPGGQRGPRAPARRSDTAAQPPRGGSAPPPERSARTPAGQRGGRK